MSIPKVNTNPPGGPVLPLQGAREDGEKIVAPIAGINRLPDQVVTHCVLDYLNIDDLNKVSQVSKRLKATVTVDLLRKKDENEVLTTYRWPNESNAWDRMARDKYHKRDYAWLNRNGYTRERVLWICEQYTVRQCIW